MEKIRRQLIKNKNNKLVYILLIAYCTVIFSIKYFGKSLKIQGRRMIAVAMALCLMFFCVSKPALVFAETIETVSDNDLEQTDFEGTEIDEDTEEGEEEDLGSEEETPSDDLEDIFYYQLTEDIECSLENMQEYGDVFAGNKDCKINVSVTPLENQIQEGFVGSEISLLYYSFDEETTCVEARDLEIPVPENYYGEVSIWGSDSFGNETEHRTLNVLVDAKAPEIIVTEGDVSGNEGEETRTYFVKMEEKETFDLGISRFFTYVDGEQTHLDNLSFGEKTTVLGENGGYLDLSFDFVVPLDGEKEVIVKAFDVFDNEKIVTFNSGTLDDSEEDSDEEESVEEIPEEEEPEEDFVVEYLLGETISVDASDASILENVYVGSKPINITVGAVEAEDCTDEIDEDSPFKIEYTDIEGIYCDINGEVSFHEGKTYTHSIDSSYSGNVTFWGVDSYGNETEHREVGIWLDMDKPVINVDKEERVDGSMILHVNVTEGGANGYGLLSHIDLVNGNTSDAINYVESEENGNFINPYGIMEYSYDLLLDDSGVNEVSISVLDWAGNETVYAEEIEVSLIPLDVDIPDNLGVHIVMNEEKIYVDPVTITNNSPYDIYLAIDEEEITVSRSKGQKSEDKDCVLNVNAEYAGSKEYLGKISGGLNKNGYTILIPGTNSESSEAKRQLIIYMDGYIKNKCGDIWQGSDLKISMKFSYKSILPYKTSDF